MVSPIKKKSPLFLANTDLLAILLGKDSNGFKLLGKKLNGLGLGFFWNSIEKKKILLKEIIISLVAKVPN